MTNQELRIAVAEADGWRLEKYGRKGWQWFHFNDHKQWLPATIISYKRPVEANYDLPNYPEDLTSIHAAVNKKDQWFCAMFTKFLSDKCKLKCCWLVQLTAKDWCEVYMEVSKTLKDK